MCPGLYCLPNRSLRLKRNFLKDFLYFQKIKKLKTHTRNFPSMEPRRSHQRVLDVAQLRSPLLRLRSGQSGRRRWRLRRLPRRRRRSVSLRVGVVIITRTRGSGPGAGPRPRRRLGCRTHAIGTGRVIVRMMTGDQSRRAGRNCGGRRRRNRYVRRCVISVNGQRTVSWRIARTSAQAAVTSSTEKNSFSLPFANF